MDLIGADTVMEMRRCGFCDREQTRNRRLMPGLRGALICSDCVWSLARDLTRPALSLPSPPARASESSTAASQDELLRVLPVGQTQTIDGIAVTLLSLEVYNDALTVIGRIRAKKNDPGRNVVWMPVVDALSSLTISDERAQKYCLSLRGAGGGQEQYRFAFTLSRSLATDVRTLKVEVTDLRWVCFDVNAPDDRSRDVRLRGPWSFEVSL